MTPEAAIYRYLSSFGIPAYAASSVPDQADFPYLTYNLVWPGSFLLNVSMEVNLWYYTESEAIPNAKAREFSDDLKDGGRMILCDDGAIWIKRGEPWCQSIVDGSGDDKVKRRYMNFDMELIA